jgi:hypothetical protein
VKPDDFFIGVDPAFGRDTMAITFFRDGKIIKSVYNWEDLTEEERLFLKERGITHEN